MNLKRCGQKWSWPNIRYYPGICLDGLRKSTKTSTKVSISAWDLLNKIHLTAMFCPHLSNMRKSHLLEQMKPFSLAHAADYISFDGMFLGDSACQCLKGSKILFCLQMFFCFVSWCWNMLIQATNNILQGGSCFCN